MMIYMKLERVGSLISHLGPPWSIEIELLHKIGGGFHNVLCRYERVVMHLRCVVCLHIYLCVCVCVCTCVHACVRARVQCICCLMHVHGLPNTMPSVVYTCIF